LGRAANLRPARPANQGALLRMRVSFGTTSAK
jgi:hypothetical protein